MRSFTRAGLMVAVALAAVATAGAVDARAVDEHATVVMTDRELGSVRGGYLSANGLNFGFGASVSTYVDGALALQSRLTVTDAGVLQSQTAGGAPNTTAFDPTLSNALGGLTGQGVTVAGGGGASTIVHSLTGDQILNVVLNSANNRTITQNTAVTLTLPAFNQLQQTTAAQQLNASLLNAVGVGAVGAIRH